MRVLATINCILMIAIGVYLFLNLRHTVLLFSAAVFVQGITLIIRYFGTKDNRNGWDIISGVINIIFGAIMFFGGTGTRIAGVLAIETFVAFWALFAGFSQIFDSFGSKKKSVKGWGWKLVGGVLTVICGVVYISMPLMGAAMLVGLAGIYASVAFIIIGVTGLAYALSSNSTTTTENRGDLFAKRQEAF